MSQAKGILPRDEDRRVLYRSPSTCGYFAAVSLEPGMDAARLRRWLQDASELVDALVARDGKDEHAGPDEKGAKLAAVAVGLAPSFFDLPGAAEAERPASFAPGNPLPHASGPLAAAPYLPAQVLFYVASVHEARVYEFLAGLDAHQEVVGVRLERGYQRRDDTEPFGYKDGVRNVVPRTDRPQVVFVHRDQTEADEPAWADGGSYMAYLKIRQNTAVFAALPDDATRDAAVGRTKTGERLDLPAGTRTADEPADTSALPAGSHVRKTGPRGRHDAVQIFRRGLPYMETSGGELAVGLHFCSFQASLEQFDVVYNDWSLNSRFPQPQPGAPDPGPDRLLDPGAGHTTTEAVGFYFVPPHHAQGLAVAVMGDDTSTRKPRRPKTGRLTVRKRVVDPGDPGKHFDRSGFRFQVLDDAQQPVPGAEMATDETGRAVCPVELPLDRTYVLEEIHAPIPVQQTHRAGFDMTRPNQQVQVTNHVFAGSPYGAF